jgi:hypothetical protein
MTMLSSSTCSPGSRPRFSLARRLGVALSALALTLIASVTIAAEPAAKPAAAAGKKTKSKKAKRAKGTMATLSQMLTDKASLVQDCAVQHALDKGSGRVDIATKVTINNRGQVISINTNVTVDKGDGTAKVKDCIETLVRAISFPQSDAPMTVIERNWTISG